MNFRLEVNSYFFNKSNRELKGGSLNLLLSLLVCLFFILFCFLFVCLFVFFLFYFWWWWTKMGGYRSDIVCQSKVLRTAKMFHTFHELVN